MTSTSNLANANSAKLKSNTLDLSLKKAKWWWTLASWKGLETGQPRKPSNKSDLGLDLETFIDDSSKDSPIWHNHWINSSRKISPLYGTTMCRDHSMKWRNDLRKNQFLSCLTRQNLSKSNATHQNGHQEQSWHNSISMEIDTLVLLYPEPSLQRNGITKSMIENFLVWSAPFKNGVTTFKDQTTRQSFIRITRIWHISETHRN